MTNFVIRVQLHSENNYAEFHRAMEQRGFKRTITSSDGASYELPRDSYSFRGNVTAEELIDRVLKAAGEVWSPAQVLVTEGTSTWQHLNAARASGQTSTRPSDRPLGKSTAGVLAVSGSP
ncbi:MAG TPA: hypothetical protein VNO30_32905 [Kofleriaceae bacterium]|nr:hypothetical protein [Kofleriaceae bacterium]